MKCCFLLIGPSSLHQSIGGQGTNTQQHLEMTVFLVANRLLSWLVNLASGLIQNLLLTIYVNLQPEHQILASYLIPVYCTKLHGVVKIVVRKWGSDTSETLQGCFDSAGGLLWLQAQRERALRRPLKLSLTVFIYVRRWLFLPKLYILFSNNKPWITKDLKTTLNEKNKAFTTGNKVEGKLIQSK